MRFNIQDVKCVTDSCQKLPLFFTLIDAPGAGPGEGPIRGVEGGPRVHAGGGPTPGTEAAAADPGQFVHSCLKVVADVDNKIILSWYVFSTHGINAFILGSIKASRF